MSVGVRVLSHMAGVQPGDGESGCTDGWIKEWVRGLTDRHEHLHDDGSSEEPVPRDAPAFPVGLLRVFDVAERVVVLKLATA